MKIIERHAPMTEIPNKEFKENRKPWISLGILKSS